MQKFNTTTTSSSPIKSQSSKISPKAITKKNTSPVLGALSDRNFDISPFTLKKITLEDIVLYLQALLNNVYEVDHLKIKELVFDFLENGVPKLRHKLQQRLSLLKYLCESLKYKQFSEIDTQIYKQCKKNMLFISINTIWMTKMQTYDFNSSDEFFTEYHKHIAVIANLIQFYFRDALVLLNDKNVDTFGFVQDETAHNVVNCVHDWENVYHGKLVPLLRKKNVREQLVPNMAFDVYGLPLNQKYIRVKEGQGHLGATIKAIVQFSEEHTLACKIIRLKEVRQTFLREIEESREKLSKKYEIKQYSPLEKDDIIGCIIYCIVAGKVVLLQQSLQALTGVLGQQNQLLSRKGVDSYRADLESAVQYLVEQNQVELITMPNQIKLFQK